MAMEELAKMLPEDLVEDMTKMFKEFSFEQSHKQETTEPPKPQIFRGHIMPPLFSAEAAEFAFSEWSLREGDVILASYPKTGTNWMLTILKRLLHQDPAEWKLVSLLPLNLTVLETGSSTKFDIWDRLPLKRRVLGTHLSAEGINMEGVRKNKAKVVYVLRNPKDSIVSFYHFFGKIMKAHANMENSPMAQFDGKWDKFLPAFTSGMLPTAMKQGEWYPGHVLSWWKEKQNKDVYFIYYEDLKKDFMGELRRLAEFLDVELSSEKADEIAEKCTLSSMKKAAETMSGDVATFQNANLRKGEIGGWKEYFTVAQSEAIDAQMEEKLGHTDVRFTYE